MGDSREPKAWLALDGISERLRRSFVHVEDPRVQRWALVAASLLFAAGAVWSIRARPDLLAGLDWRYLALAVAVIPFSVLLNGFGFLLTARLVGAPIGFRKAVEVAVLGTAANLLPLPGGSMVRVVALKAAGTRIRHGSTVTILAGLIWLGVSLVAAGWVLLWRGGQPFPGAGLLTGGLVALTGGGVGCLQFSRRVLVPVAMLLEKVARMALMASQLLLCFAALGAPASLAQCVVITVSAVVASAISIAPGGLGIREALAAILAPLVGVSPPVAFLASSLGRLVGLVVAMPLAALLAARLRRPAALR